MPIDKKDIEKYIFDPENPQQCIIYKLLLRTVQKDSFTFFSPDFLKYFFGNEILNYKFKNELWDIPQNYTNLSFNQKLSLYTQQLSSSDWNEFKKNIDLSAINTEVISKYKYFSRLIDLTRFDNINSHLEYYSHNFSKYIFKNIFKNESSSYVIKDNTSHDKHFVIFSKSNLDILKLNIKKASILITLEENIDKFLKYNTNQNIKPIFLKQIEDIDILLHVIEQDVAKERFKNVKKEEIPTIDNVEIKDFFSIKNLKLENLKEKKEIYILGENGDGKTLLLQAIAIALKGSQKDGQEKFRDIKDKYSLALIDSKEEVYNSDESTLHTNMFAYGANRNNSCEMEKDISGYLTLFEKSNVKLENPIVWLKKQDSLERYKKELERNKKELEKEEVILPMRKIIEIIENLLDGRVKISVNPKEVTFTERDTEKVDFDRLSAGYKGVITIICDMLARLSENQPYITEKEYQGIVLIDEVELHLHPKWKYDFMKKLRDIFPLIQFIVTTHSPTVILGASKEAVFYKIYKDDGEVCISNQIVNKGYTNNSLISSPLFDMDNFASRDYPNSKLSDDDYVYDKIHQVVSEKINKDKNLSEEEILKLIDEELDKI